MASSSFACFENPLRCCNANKNQSTKPEKDKIDAAAFSLMSGLIGPRDRLKPGTTLGTTLTVAHGYVVMMNVVKTLPVCSQRLSVRGSAVTPASH